MSPAEPGLAAAGVLVGRVRLRTLVLLRWVAVAGQATTVLGVALVLGHALPLETCLALIGLSVVVNLALSLHRSASWRAASVRLSDRAASALLAYDLLQLAALLYLTGGLVNPFALLLLAPIAVSATVLSRRSIIALCALALACVSLLAAYHRPLPGPPDGPPLMLPGYYLAGVWAALVIGIGLIAAYAGRVAEEARRISNALDATQLALAREQRRVAVGAMAAAAAHELGSPLSSIAVAAREIARALPQDHPLSEDVSALMSQTGRCRDILARLAARTEEDEASPHRRLPVSAMAEIAAAPHDIERVRLWFRATAENGALEPVVAPASEIVHGLGNLIHNAVQFANAGVEIATRWSETEVSVTITDDGPGFAPDVLDHLGEPYRSTRGGSGEHMGLGVFIATTLLERTGAGLDFANQPGGGAVVTVRWPRARLERTAEEVLL